MSDLIIGTSAGPSADVNLIKAAGIGWVRQDFSFPFVDRIGGEVTEDFLAEKKRAVQWKESGLSLMGVSPIPGLGANKPDAAGNLKLTWASRFPDWFGTPGTQKFLDNHHALCAFLGEEFKGIVSLWQIANELDIEIFAGPLDLRRACDFIIAGAKGLKSTDPGALVGTNSVYFERSFYLYGRLFGGSDACLDYCGVDSYFGSWRAGGPDRWDAAITELARITGARILVNEWGFASQGEVMTREERDRVETANVPACQFRKWQYGWREGHSEALQADYIREMFKAIQKHRSELLGAFFYRWEDQKTCWQCGKSDCPLETAWGMVHHDQSPKPAYTAFKESVKALRS